MRKMTLGCIAVKNFDEDRKVLECYLGYDRRGDRSGYFITWLPLERDSFGGVSFSIANLVSTPVRLIHAAKRFSQKRADIVLGQVLTGLANENSVLRAEFRDDYNSIRNGCCKDWDLPDFNVAVTNIKSKQLETT